jgi:hypothetical protein
MKVTDDATRNAPVPSTGLPALIWKTKINPKNVAIPTAKSVSRATALRTSVTGGLPCRSSGDE